MSDNITSPPKIIKSYNTQTHSSLGELKTKSYFYQLGKASSLFILISEAIKSSSIPSSKTTGKVIISLHLGGVNAIELEEIERVR